MSPSEWIINNFDTEYDEISWGNSVYTKIDDFILMFDNAIKTAIEENKNVVQSIKDADKNNSKGFHKHLNKHL